MSKQGEKSNNKNNQESFVFIEEKLSKKIYNEIKDKSISSSEFDRIILKEIKNDMSFSEDWQKYYSKERIKNSIRKKYDILLTTDRKKKYSKVGGWLFIFILRLFFGLILFVLLFESPSNPLGFLGICLAVYTVYIGYLLIKIKLNAVKNAKIFLGISIFLDLIVIMGPNNNIESVIGLITSFIWLLYFFNSKRVKDVYVS